MRGSSKFNSLDRQIYPYMFALKEGKMIHDDFLDYSLLLLQVTHADVLRSPNKEFISNPFIRVLIQ